MLLRTNRSYILVKMANVSLQALSDFRDSAMMLALSRDKASIIAEYRKSDRACRETFAIFTRIYARFVRNSMLASLPYGGAYIAGGIAMKNPDILTSKEFRKELYKKAVYSDIIKKIPLFLIADQGIGMKGAAFLAQRESR